MTPTMRTMTAMNSCRKKSVSRVVSRSCGRALTSRSATSPPTTRTNSPQRFASRPTVEVPSRCAVRSNGVPSTAVGTSSPRSRRRTYRRVSTPATSASRNTTMPTNSSKRSASSR
ncbi:hypothetical protein [Halosegnis marinus]|uniref:hypothetical protein n=1 Tax=Halosegnis marinus TaxID=3034023 RepID=UPI00360747D6